MYALAGARPSEPATHPIVRVIELRSDDYESLLVAWLQELLYYTESESNLFSEFRIQALTPTFLRAEVTGSAIGRIDKVIKAVTYHNLSIRRTWEGFEVTIVFDV
jgi:SHS2 domain-containing protein